MADILAATELALVKRREAKKAYKKANPEKVKEQKRRYREKHHDELLAKDRARAQANGSNLTVETREAKAAARAAYNRMYYQRKKDENEQAKAIIAASKVAPPNF